MHLFSIKEPHFFRGGRSQDRLDSLSSNEEEVDLLEVVNNLQKSFKEDIDSIDITVIKSMDYWYYENITSAYLEKVLHELDARGV